MEAVLTQKFRERVANSGLTHAGVARSLDVTRQYFHRVWNNQDAPSVRFMTRAIEAGYGETFADIAQPAPTPDKGKAAA